MEEIRAADGELVAMVVRAGFRPDGVRFLSAPGDAIQLGVSGYRQGTTVAPHTHHSRDVRVQTGQELIHVDQGRITVDLYDRKDRFLARTVLSSGDTILFLCGGHGLTAEEDTRIIEVKQGPYSGRAEDKRSLSGKGITAGEDR